MDPRGTFKRPNPNPNPNVQKPQPRLGWKDRNRRAFATLDKDHNGSISREEFLEFYSEVLRESTYPYP